MRVDKRGFVVLCCMSQRGVNYLRFGGVECYDDFVCLGWSELRNERWFLVSHVRRRGNGKCVWFSLPLDHVTLSKGALLCFFMIFFSPMAVEFARDLCVKVQFFIGFLLGKLRSVS